MKQRVFITRTAAVVLSALALLSLTGCISSHSDVTYGSMGPAVRGDTLRQIKIGHTSKEWLLGTLGEPSRSSQTPDGKEVLTYVYTKKVDSNFDFCPFLNTHDRREEQTVYVFELQNGVVCKFWKES
jgi:outer membrane protein assembly factor BamE (lipoprotein component of BamABCDE complex)